jgi:hypothetical protein
MMYLFLILLFSFIIQIFPRIGYSDNGIDLYRWLLYAKKIRENNYKLPQYIDKYIVKARFSYPPVLLIFMSYFSQKFLDRFNYLISPFFSIIENIALFTIVYWISDNINVALVSSIVYVSTSANILENMFLGTRSAGQLVYFIATIALLGYLHYDLNPIWFVLGNILILLTHRMSSQLMLITSFVFALAYGDVLILFYFIFSIILTIILSKGFYFQVLKGHIIQVKFWYKQITKNANKIKLSPLDFFKNVFLRNTFIFLALYYGYISDLDVVDVSLLLLFILIIMMSILTTFIKPLRCIGEGSRYVAFATPFIAMFIAIKFESEYYLLLSFVLVSLLPALYKQYIFSNNKLDASTNSYLTKEVKYFLDSFFEKNNNKEVKFMSYPPNLDDYVAYKYKNSRVMFHDNGFALKYCYIPPFNSNYRSVDVLDMIFKNKIDLFVSLTNFELDGFSCIEVNNVYLHYQSYPKLATRE